MTSRRLAVSIQNVSKTYRITQADSRPTLASEALRQRLRHPFQRRPSEEFPALTDVMFDVTQGEAVGIIGRNGAGKSTLLKILSRIVEPSSGRILLYGRVGSLLEVGTGFHPELTGRENVFLNGAILGMGRKEIARQFDSIVEFAEVRQFIDTPVKRYSSGMYVRLAFAVAAHLNPEILIVDEVLSVGDAQFQRKCLGKMGDVSRQEGRTVLFVSHNMAAIESFCTRCVYLEAGRVSYDGTPREAIQRYLSSRAPLPQDGSRARADGSADESDRAPNRIIRSVAVTDERGEPVGAIRMGDGLSVAIHAEGLAIPRHVAVVRITTDFGVDVAVVNTNMKPIDVFNREEQQERLILHLPHLPLMPGQYWVDVSVLERERKRWAHRDQMERAATFEVEAADVYRSGFQLGGRTAKSGIIFVDGSWQVRSRDSLVAATVDAAADR
jgi:lipopolysaccharide transport system ATP-binding protein